MTALSRFFEWLYAWTGLLLGKLPGRRLALPGTQVVRLRLEGRLAEGLPGAGWLGLRWERQPHLVHVLELLELASRDPAVSGIWIEASGLHGGWATLQTLRSALAKARSRGKKVIIFLEESDNALSYLASVADRLVMAPAGVMNLTGLRAEVLFLKGALERARIEPEFLRLGEYKSAIEPFTRTSLSPEARDALDAILDDLYEQLVTGIAEGRRIAPETVRTLIDKGPYRASEAKKAGLLDEVLYEDELESKLGEFVYGNDVKPTVVEAGLYLRRARRRAPPPGARFPFPRIALIPAEGLIRVGKTRRSQLGRSVAAGTFVDALRRARDDDRISAIVLRVNSPGGSGLASDLIWREVRLARRKKPVVVSMGDVAASGGYYLSMPANWIVAEPGTLTGSIGVIAGKFNFRGLYEFLGLAKETIDRGARAGAQSDYRPFTKEERLKLQLELQAFYDDFVEKAAEGRKLEKAALETVARGRVWTGKQALAHALVDQLGGIVEAIEAAKRFAGIPVAQPVRLVAATRPLPALLAGFSWNPLRTLPRGVSDAINLTESMGQFRDGELLAICPFQLKLF